VTCRAGESRTVGCFRVYDPLGDVMMSKSLLKRVSFELTRRLVSTATEDSGLAVEFGYVWTGETRRDFLSLYLHKPLRTPTQHSEIYRPVPQPPPFPGYHLPRARDSGIDTFRYSRSSKDSSQKISLPNWKSSCRSLVTYTRSPSR